MNVIHLFLKKPTRIKHFINKDKIYIDHLCCNHNISYNIYDYNKDCYIWYLICENPYLTHMIIDNIHLLNEKCWESICSNINAIDIISNNLHKININGWRLLCLNINAIDIITKNLHKLDIICYQNLCKNINAIELITDNIQIMDTICWKNICSNSNAMKLIELNKKKIFEHYWKYLLKNTNPKIIYLIEEFIETIKLDSNYSFSKLQIYLYELCDNPNTISIIKEYLPSFDKYCINKICKNINAIDLIDKKNLEKKALYNICKIESDKIIDILSDKLEILEEKSLEILSSNSYAIELIEKNIEIFDQPMLFRNKNIIIIDENKTNFLIEIINTYIYDKI
jgi:hypothetical protein